MQYEVSYDNVINDLNETFRNVILEAINLSSGKKINDEVIIKSLFLAELKSNNLISMTFNKIGIHYEDIIKEDIINNAILSYECKKEIYDKYYKEIISRVYDIIKKQLMEIDELFEYKDFRLEDFNYFLFYTFDKNINYVLKNIIINAYKSAYYYEAAIALTDDLLYIDNEDEIQDIKTYKIYMKRITYKPSNVSPVKRDNVLMFVKRNKKNE